MFTSCVSSVSKWGKRGIKSVTEGLNILLPKYGNTDGSVFFGQMSVLKSLKTGNNRMKPSPVICALSCALTRLVSLENSLDLLPPRGRANRC